MNENRSSKSTKIGIIGLGHVGKITAKALRVRAEIATYDKATDCTYPTSQFEQCDFLVVCVNTPSSPDGSADLTQVHQAFRAMPPRVPVVVRSTVPPGTSVSLAQQYSREVIFWPEYIGETRFAISTWDRVVSETPFHLIGTENSIVASKWIDFIAETYGPLMKLYRIDPTEAELVKYMENSYFAVKVTFVNEFRRLAEMLNLDWQRVREGWLLDPRVDRDHSDAFRGTPGFGGKCIPKDVTALLQQASEYGIEMPLMNSVDAINRDQQNVISRSEPHEPMN